MVAAIRHHYVCLITVGRHSVCVYIRLHEIADTDPRQAIHILRAKLAPDPAKLTIDPTQLTREHTHVSQDRALPPNSITQINSN